MTISGITRDSRVSLKRSDLENMVCALDSPTPRTN